MKTQTTNNKIVARIYGLGRGWSFSQIDFQDLAPAATTRQVLSRLRERGTIRSVLRGIYDYPRQSKTLGQLSPDMHQVAKALARRHGWRIQPTGPTALNLLGLSTQVPAQIAYLSDGPSRSWTIGRQSLRFQQGGLKEAGFKLEESRLLVQALKELGPEHADAAVRAQLVRMFPAALWPKVIKDTAAASDWIHDILHLCLKESMA